MGVNIKDFLWESLWDRKLIGLKQAFELLDTHPSSDSDKFGEPNVKVTIWDTGVISENGIITHVDLSGTVTGASESKDKVFKILNFSNDPVTFENDNPVHPNTYRTSAHGTNVAGIALANANFDGIIGVCPNARLIAAQIPLNVSEPILRTAEAMKYLFGISRYQVSGSTNYLPILEDSSSILISSAPPDVTIGSPSDEALADALNKVLRRGRKGRGGLLFFAAGNEDKLLEFGSSGSVNIAAYPQVISCAASTLLINSESIKNNSGKLDFELNEKRAPYSSYGKVDLSAPSNSASTDEHANTRHAPPLTYRIFSTDFPETITNLKSDTKNFVTSFDAEEFDLISPINSSTILFNHNANSIAQASASENILTVFDSSLFNIEQGVQIVKKNDRSITEAIRIEEIDPGGVSNTIKIYDGLVKDYDDGIIELNAHFNVTNLKGFNGNIPNIGVFTFDVGTTNPFAIEPAKIFTVNEWVQIIQSDSPNPPIIEYKQLSDVTSISGGTAATLTFTTAIQSTFNSTSGNVVVVSPVHKISINDTTLIKEGKHIQLDYPEISNDFKKEDSESVLVLKKLLSIGGSSNDLLINHSFKNHKPGMGIVFQGNEEYTGEFGGTSAAAPLCGGVASLILSAKPSLTGLEVLEILRQTSKKINAENSGFTNSGTGVNDGPQDGKTGPLGLGKWKTIDGVDVINSSTGDIIQPSGFVNLPLANDTVVNQEFIQVLSPPASWVEGMVIQIGTGTEKEIRAISERIEGGAITTLTVVPLLKPHSTGTMVDQGLVAERSDWYGYGRIDAKLAVKKALEYSHDDRDLMIRDFEDDEGNSSSNPDFIQSPDIWFRNSVDSETEHQAPLPILENEFYIRVFNRGNKYPSLEGHQARLYLAISDGLPADIQSDIVEINDAENKVIISGEDHYQLIVNGQTIEILNNNTSVNNGTYTVSGVTKNDGTTVIEVDESLVAGMNGEVKYKSNSFTTPFYFPSHLEDDKDLTGFKNGSSGIYNMSVIDLNPIQNIGGGDNFTILSSTWSDSDQPSSPLADDLKFYAIVEITPYDGITIGPGADRCNNISYREFAFSFVEFREQGTTNLLQEELEVDEFGTQVVLPFSIDVNYSYSKFETENIEIEIKRIKSGGTDDLAYLRFDGSWVVEDESSNPVTWVDAIDPVILGTTTPATLKQYEVTFEGDINVSNQQNTLEITVFVKSSTSNAIVSTVKHVVSINESALESKGLLKGAPPLFPKSYAFADMENLTQIQDHAFGPKLGNETDVFRVTSRFTATVATNAYAIVKGKMMVQPGVVAGTVNLILKPFTQPIPGFTPVKYIVYRGLKESDFINASNSTEVTPKDPSNSEWITELYNIHESQNGSGSTFLSKAIGYDATINGNTSIDKEFFKVDSDFQLPMALRGIQLGEFDINHTFGIDIILEEGEFTPDFDFVRSEFEEIDISEIGNAFLNKLEREKILNFIDPAAFYGLHVKKNGLIEYRDSSNNTVDKKEQEIYDDIVEKFYTKNTTYVDIRNELGNSYNFFEHYNDGSVDEFNIQVKTDPSGSYNAQKYGTEGWPILILNSISLTTSNETHDFSFKLRADENPKPILYIEHGGLQDLTKAEGGRFIEGNNLLQSGNLETEDLTFEQPNTDDPDVSGNKQNISWLLKLHYSRQIDTSVDWSSIPKAVKTESYLDNVFGPVNLDIIPWNSDNNIKWIGVQDKKYIDASVNNFGYVAERGVAVEDTAAPEGGRVILYASALDSFKTPVLFPPVNGLTGGTSKKASFFEEAMSFAGYRLFFDVIDDAGTPITSLKLEPTTVESAPAQAMMILGLSRPEFDVLKALTGLSNDYPATAFLEEIGSGSNFIKYKVGMQGLDTNGEYANVFPPTDIEVYSTDGLLFFTKKFSENEPLPTFYIRTCEEHPGILNRPISLGSFPSAIKSLDTGANKFTISGDKLDYLAVNDKIKIKGSTGNDGPYTVVDLSLVSGDTVIEVSPSFSNTTANGMIHLLDKFWEDHFIDIDKGGTISGTQPMRTIVDDFVNDVSAVINDVNAKSNLEGHINNYAPKILDRAREYVKNIKPDDRILFWARIKMLVTLKDHPFVLQSISGRNELVRLFEKLSRGYELDFTGTPSGAKKVIVSGFDPFRARGLTSDILRNNNSGAIALSLHGETIPGLNGGPDLYLQCPIFPVRYRDFDQDEGEGVVEQVFSQFVDETFSGATLIDAAITVSLGSTSFPIIDIERFAARTRAGRFNRKDSECLSPPPFPLSGYEFYQSTLPFTYALNGITNQNNPYSVGYDQSAWWIDINDNNQNNNAANRVTQLDSSMSLNENDYKQPVGNLPDVKKSLAGSGSVFLSNEIMYRVARLRETGSNIQPKTGHIHVPGISPVPISSSDNANTSTLIGKIIETIGRMSPDL